MADVLEAPTGVPLDRRRPRLRFPGGAAHALVWTALAGVTFDATLRNDLWSVAGVLWGLVGVGAVVTARRAGASGRVAWVAAAFVPWFAIRSSAWVLVPDALIAAAVLCWAVTPDGRGATAFLRRGEALLSRLWTGPAAMWHSLVNVRHQLFGGRRSAGAGAVVRGIAIAVPVVALLGALLAAGDAFFAAWLTPGTEVGSIVEHAFLVLVGASFLALLLSPDAPSVLPADGRPRRLGDVEVTIVLGAVTALFGVWAIAQAVAATGGREMVLETAGLTFAEWARSGFFQLMWVAGLTACLLIGLTAAARGERLRRTRLALSLSVAALTLLMVAVSLVKLDLYADTFGLTMLRLYVTVFAWWLGAMFVLLGAALVSRRVAGVSVRLAVMSALLGVFAMNVANPEAIVVETNLDRFVDGENFDVAYLDHLGPDGLVAVADGLDVLPEPIRSQVVTEVCVTRYTTLFDDRDGSIGVPDSRGGDGFLGWNRSSRQLEDVRRELC